MAGEGKQLDATIRMTQEVIEMGSSSAAQMHGQTDSLKNTNSILGRMQNSAIPGADKLVSMINKAEQKNKVVLALVIALCIATLLYATGVIDMIKAVSKAVPVP